MVTESWYFDGSTGCETCGGSTGYYAYKPSKPHPNCNCKISRILEVCELVARERYEVPGEEYEVDNGPGSTPNSIIVLVYQEVWVIIHETWECIDLTTGEKSEKEKTYDWVENRLIRSCERTEV